VHLGVLGLSCFRMAISGDATSGLVHKCARLVLDSCVFYICPKMAILKMAIQCGSMPSNCDGPEPAFRLRASSEHKNEVVEVHGDTWQPIQPVYSPFRSAALSFRREEMSMSKQLTHRPRIPCSDRGSSNSATTVI
jgi:hypothetical protein